MLPTCSKTIRLFSVRVRRNAFVAPKAARPLALRISPSPLLHLTRLYASSSGADAAIEEIQDLYATARDEFEIAAEETEKKTVYAADDRAAAQGELVKLKEAFEKHVHQSSPEVGEEIQRRVGQRIRELDNAMTALEDSAMED